MSIVRIILFAALLAEPALAAERSTKFSIGNMTCALCPFTVKAAMSRVRGVISVEINRELALAAVTYDDTQTTTDEIAKASSNAGYPATAIEMQ